MPGYPKQKSENFQNFGGINQKLSQYITGQMEFLNLQNLAFQSFGALCSTPGSTQFMLAGTSSPITGIAEKTSIVGGFAPVELIIAGTNLGLFQIQGSTFSQIYNPLYAGTYLPSIFQANQATYSLYDFAGGGGFFFAANGVEFVGGGFGGVGGTIQYSLPFPYFGGATSVTTFGTTGMINATLTIYEAFIRNDGLVGPYVIENFVPPSNGCTGMAFKLPDLVPDLGLTYGSFGISGILIWYSLNGSVPVGTSTIFAAGSSVLIHDNFASFIVQTPPDNVLGSFVYGDVQKTDTFFTVPPIDSQNPQTIEMYANQLFMAGFRESPDNVWFSQIGIPEIRDLDGFFPVREKDGDIVTKLITYFTNLIIFKVNSTHILSGTGPDSFVLTEATNQYGCLSNSAACVFQQRLFFLDKNGIAEFNGTNTAIASTNMEPVFKRMNISAARITSVMTHVKSRKEVWCAIPVDGANYNNLIVIYDYIANAWSTKSANNLTYISEEFRSLTAAVPYFGDASGMVYQIGPSFFQDNGNNYTAIMKSRFIGDMGHSVEKQFRRLYMDVSVPSGATFPMTANFYSDYGSSPALSMTFTISSFQNRIDFGVPGKALSVEIIYGGGNYLQINGFTIEYRFQRAV